MTEKYIHHSLEPIKVEDFSENIKKFNLSAADLTGKRILLAGTPFYIPAEFEVSFSKGPRTAETAGRTFDYILLGDPISQLSENMLVMYADHLTQGGVLLTRKTEPFEASSDHSSPATPDVLTMYDLRSKIEETQKFSAELVTLPAEDIKADANTFLVQAQLKITKKS